jgi:hypothetical protein
MIIIDWDDVDPTPELRARVETRFAALRPRGAHPHLALRRLGSGCEAEVRMVSASRSTVLRLHGENLGDVVDRVLELLHIVERETERQRLAAGA